MYTIIAFNIFLFQIKTKKKKQNKKKLLDNRLQNIKYNLKKITITWNFLYGILNIAHFLPFPY